MSKNKDTQLIWESYQTNLNEAEEFSMDKLVYMGEKLHIDWDIELKQKDYAIQHLQETECKQPALV